MQEFRNRKSARKTPRPPAPVRGLPSSTFSDSSTRSLRRRHAPHTPPQQGKSASAKQQMCKTHQLPGRALASMRAPLAQQPPRPRPALSAGGFAIVQSSACTRAPAPWARCQPTAQHRPLCLLHLLVLLLLLLLLQPRTAAAARPAPAHGPRPAAQQQPKHLRVDRVDGLGAQPQAPLGRRLQRHDEITTTQGKRETKKMKTERQRRAGRGGGHGQQHATGTSSSVLRRRPLRRGSVDMVCATFSRDLRAGPRSKILDCCPRLLRPAGTQTSPMTDNEFVGRV